MNRSRRLRGSHCTHVLEEEGGTWLLPESLVFVSSARFCRRWWSGVFVVEA